jgi:hypothetical protein
MGKRIYSSLFTLGEEVAKERECFLFSHKRVEAQFLLRTYRTASPRRRGYDQIKILYGVRSLLLLLLVIEILKRVVRTVRRTTTNSYYFFHGVLVSTKMECSQNSTEFHGDRKTSSY